MKSLPFIFTLGLCSGLVACSAENQNTKSQTIAKPNPAAVFCIDQGGQYQIIILTDGDKGMCKLPDGSLVDAWEHFNKHQE